MKIDVTDIFWNLLEKILIFDYDVVRESTEYEQISLYINSSDTFILKIDENTQIETSDVNHLFYKTKNIWLSILMHFLNNGFIVTQLYIVTLQGKSLEKAMDENYFSILSGLNGLMILWFSFNALKKYSATLVKPL